MKQICTINRKTKHLKKFYCLFIGFAPKHLFLQFIIWKNNLTPSQMFVEDMKFKSVVSEIHVHFSRQIFKDRSFLCFYIAYKDNIWEDKYLFIILYV